MTHEDVMRWRGFSHAELYAQLHDGPGPVASAVAAQRWADLAAGFATITHDLATAVADARAEWQGASATMAFAQLGEVTAVAERVGESAASMRLSVEQQADHIGRARAAMPAPGHNPSQQPDPTAGAATQVLAVQSDHEPIERATSEAARRAYEVMQAYENDTTATTGGLRTFDETVDTAAVDAVRHGGVAEFPMSLIPQQSQGPVGQAQLVSVASAEVPGLLADEPDIRARPVAAEPLSPSAGATVRAVPRQRFSPVRRTSDRKPGLYDAHPLTPIAAHTGGGTERAVSRRLGEPLVIAHPEAGTGEPPKRRRDRHEPDKITERVEGADAEVPPPVIGASRIVLDDVRHRT